MPQKSKRDQIKKLLLDKKRKMWNDLRDDLFRKLGKEFNTMFENPNDIEELSILDIIEDTGIAVADVHKQELEETDEALRKLDNGTYGMCNECGSEIADERLKIMPYATLCVECAKAHEKKA